MNTALSQVGAQSVNLTFVTGTLSRLGTHLALAVKHAPLSDSQGPWDTHPRRALTLATIWAGFLTGAIVSGAATPRFGTWILLAPMLILLVLAARDRQRRLRPDPKIRGRTASPVAQHNQSRFIWQCLTSLQRHSDKRGAAKQHVYADEKAERPHERGRKTGDDDRGRSKSMKPLIIIHSHLPESSRRWVMARMIIKTPSTMK